MNGSFGVKLEGNETPRHQEKMLIISCTVSGHRHDLITEQHTACCSSGSWSIIHSQYLAQVPSLQRDQRQPNLRTGTPIVLDVFVSFITREF